MLLLISATVPVVTSIQVLSTYKFQDIYSLKNYALKDLGTLGGKYSIALSINDRSDVVGYSLTKSNEWRGFLWNKGKMTKLDDRRSGSSWAEGINNSGSIVGWIKLNKQALALSAVFAHDGHMGLNLISKNQPGHADSINDSNTVVGSCKIDNTSDRACYWDRSGLHFLDFHAKYRSIASSVNRSNYIVGNSEKGPFMWHNGLLEFLPTPKSSTGAVAKAINDLNEIVGYIGYAGQHRACIWTYHRDRIAFRRLSPKNTEANSINNSGQIVGNLILSDGTAHAVSWSNYVMRDLNSDVSNSSDWTLVDARSVNNRSQIVGLGLHDRHLRAFMMTPD